MRDNDPFSELIRSIEENLQEGGLERGDRGDRDDDDQGGNRGGNRGGGDFRGFEGPAFNWRRLLPFFIVLLIFLSFNRIIGFYTDFAWYDSLDLSSVFYTRLWAQLALFGVGALLFWLFVAANVIIGRRLEPDGLVDTPLQQITDALGLRIVPIVLLLAALFAFFMGLTVSALWEDVLLYFNQTNFGIVDPIFQRDVSFFVFTLPVWQAARTWLMTTVVLTLIAVALLAGVGLRGWNVRRPVLLHLAALGALALLLIAWQYRLDAWQLVYSQRGAVFGAGYTDVNAQLPALNILAVLTLVAAALLVIVAWLQRGWRVIVAVPVIWLAATILAGSVYPSLVEQFRVNPNQLNLESEYIANNIEYTRAAYDLEDIADQSYDASTALTPDALIAEPETIRNIRLWDYRPLLDTYNQVQALRQYYQFNDIDIDRYTVDGERRQVMLAARELVPDQLNDTAQTWINRRLIYTHGYGVAASPVAQVTRDGLPEFLLRDLPPEGVIDVTQPQIYFGELTNDYVIAGTEQLEFDYPRDSVVNEEELTEEELASDSDNVFSSFSADSGIDMSLLNRLLFAVRFADVNMLLNGDITPDSQLLWRRNIVERINEVAPFLLYDYDPYIVIGDDGRLHWIIDAYTVSNRYPYSVPAAFPPAGHPERPPRVRLNYVRNPVKIVISAYDGTMNFYLREPDEPIVAAYADIFPDLFTPFEEMPADLLDNIRYPNDLFSVQSQVFLNYHMTDVREFYNREDEWAWPNEEYRNQGAGAAASSVQPVDPYYVLMQLPGSEELDFVQILPFTPSNRDNMIAWLAAQNDPEKYGERIVFDFGRSSLVFGPEQIEARINQDPLISQQLSLWNQQGSEVIRGNLLVLPIGESLLYVEPLYLQAENGEIPELRRVILATNDQVVMEPNLGTALTALFDRDILAETGLTELAAGPSSPSGGPLETTDVGDAAAVDQAAADQSTTDQATADQQAAGDASLDELIRRANDQYERAQESLAAGDFGRYGNEIEALEQTLIQLAQTANVAPASSDVITPGTVITPGSIITPGSVITDSAPAEEAEANAGS